MTALRKEHVNQISGIEKKIEDLEEMIKFLVEQQNPNLDDKDINNMMTRDLSKESSSVELYSSTSTHVPYEQVYMIGNYFVL